MEKNNKTLNVPHLRFPEFSGPWKNQELQSIAPNISSGKDKPNNEGAVVLYGSTGIMGYTTSESYKNEIVIVARVGANAGQLQLVNIPCGVTDNALVVNAKSWNKYVFYYLQHFNLNKLVFGSGQPLITGGMLKKIKIWAGDNAERNKIVHLLSLIEERIDTQKKIIEKYESLIRGLCENLTRQGTANKTIDECLECHSSTLQENAVLDAGRYPVYGATGVCGYTDAPEASGDGILIIKDGASVGVTHFANGSYSSIGTLNRLTAKKDINLRYVYYCLKVLNFTPYKTGLAIPHIYFKDYGKHKIWCPTLEQQSRIADALTTIDDKIQVEKSLLEQLNSQKRYMLNQLFI